MKKLVFMFVAVAAISFASCGGNKTEQAAPVDTDSIENVDTLAADSVAADSVAADTVAAE
jgi:hypothetical protein